MPRSTMGPTLVVIGVLVIVVGLLVWSGALSWFGRLPGDIRLQRPNVSFYFPITSMVLVSIVLSVVLAIIQRFR
ncbi:MAG TPA: DUF2905 domain-containing protein [Gemmatimonadaceae bacterium]|nr:DUF2905 domain-containing protein [Gemmatimonadaceae bacterium]